MKLYNVNTDAIEDIQILVVKKKGRYYTNKANNKTLNKAGLYKIKYLNEPDFNDPALKYTKYNKTQKIVGEFYEIKYIIVEEDLDKFKTILLEDLSAIAKKIMSRPEVDTGLEYSVDGGLDDLRNFELGQKYDLALIKSVDGEFFDITNEEYNVVIEAVELKRIELLKTKWKKEQEINLIETFEELKEYYKTIKDW